MLVEKYSSAFPTNILTPEDVLVDVSHQQLMLRSSNRDTGRYDVQEKVEEGSLVDASDTSPEDDVNTEYNWISETFFRKSYADEESVGTEQLAEQASLQAGEDNFSLTEEDKYKELLAQFKLLITRIIENKKKLGNFECIPISTKLYGIIYK